MKNLSQKVQGFIESHVCYRSILKRLAVLPSGSQTWYSALTDTQHPKSNLISLGLLVTMVVVIPFAFIKLEENMGFQWFSGVFTSIMVRGPS